MIYKEPTAGPTASGSQPGDRETVKDTAHWILNHDFCPWLNPYVEWLRRPIGWLVCGILISGLAGTWLGPQGFILMSGLIGVLVIGTAWPYLAMGGLRAEIRYRDQSILEGDELVAELKIFNRWPIPVFGVAIEGQFLQSSESMDEKEVAVSLMQVPGWRKSVFQWPHRPLQRGRLPQGNPTISTSFPFGIYTCRAPLSIDHRPTVWPKPVSLSGVPTGTGKEISFDCAPSQRSGSEHDISGAREYRQGDSLRSINWAQTARCREVIVSERQSVTKQMATLVVDLDPAKHTMDGSGNTYECGIRIAASLAGHLHQHDAEVHVIACGLPVNTPNRSSTHGGIEPVWNFLALLPKLHELQSSPSPGLQQGFGQNQLRSGRNYLIRPFDSELSSCMFGKEAVEFVISGKGASVDVVTASAQGVGSVIQADRHIMPQLQTLWGQACVNA